MEVDLHLAKPPGAYPCQGKQVFRFILLGGVEEGVSRRPAIRVAKISELLGKLLHPPTDTLGSPRCRCPAQLRLKMVRDAE